jgi:uncharacterized membrane protein HdeD (DUF308 family)
VKTLLVTIIVVIGLLCIAVGVIYLVEPAHSLPSFFPSHTSLRAVHANVKHTRKGMGAVVLGAVLVVVGIVVAAAGRRPMSAPM